jgi:hypothetical protein
MGASYGYHLEDVPTHRRELLLSLALTVGSASIDYSSPPLLHHPQTRQDRMRKRWGRRDVLDAEREVAECYDAAGRGCQ